MPRQKSNVTKAVFNTSIRMETFIAFRDYCNDLNYPMNTIIEAFMDGFVEGRFQLGFDENNKLIVRGKPEVNNTKDTE